MYPCCNRYQPRSMKAAIAYLAWALVATRVNGGIVFVTNTLDSGPGSLREAILGANESSGTHTLTCTNISGMIALASALPPIARNTTIVGPGSELLTVSGSNNVRVFQVAQGAVSKNRSRDSFRGLGTAIHRNQFVRLSVLHRFGDHKQKPAVLPCADRTLGTPAFSGPSV